MKYVALLVCMLMIGCTRPIPRTWTSHPENPSEPASVIPSLSALPAKDFPAELRIAGDDDSDDHVSHDHSAPADGAAEPSAPRPDPSEAHEGHGGHR